MTCKDCLHNEMCYGTHTDDSPICCDYMDKSRYVELPCKVGDTVYCVDYAVAHINTWYDRHEGGWRNSLELVPRNGANSITVARMRDCEVKNE